jgi:hypothetical protein
MGKILNSPAPTLGLAMTASCLFMWGRNWHMYAWADLGLSLALVLGAGSLLGLLVGRLARARGRAGSKLPAVLPGVLVGGLLVMTLLVFLFIPFGPMAAQLGLRTRHVIFPLALAVFLALYAARGFRLVNVFLMVWLLISLAGGLINIRSAPAEEKIAEARFIADDGVITENGLRLALKKKPDIYLYFLESYHSPYAMRLIYDYDAGPMAEYLREKNFMVYDRTLSNSHYTIASILDTLTMRLNQNIARGNLDAGPKIRRVLGGDDDNHLFKTLKDNGYHITFITMGSDYFFRVQGPNLDASDVDSIPIAPLLDLCPAISTPLGVLYLNWRGEDRWFLGTRAERVRQAAEVGRRRGGPFMVVFKGGAGHVDATYHGTRQEFEAWKPEYLKAVASGDAEMKEILEYLDEADPEALVILIGDHGAWGYRSHFDESMSTGDLEGFRGQLTELGLTLDEVAQNFFGAFLAIRLPGGEQLDISQGLALNHVNLFRHVFAYLNDDPNLLSAREPALSLLSARDEARVWGLSHSDKFILGRDNQPVLERYEAAE